MYFIQFGTAYVKYRDRLGREKLLGRKLEVGYHFGHIALFYNTRRSATVVSGDFSTMGRLSKQGYETLVEKMPEFAAVMEKICQEYNDEAKLNIASMLKKIEFLSEGISGLMINELIYTMKSNQYDMGQLIFKPGDPMNTIQMIEEGVVEIFIYFEGTKFIIDRLFTGSVINYRNLFLDDEPTQVYA